MGPQIPSAEHEMLRTNKQAVSILLILIPPWAITFRFPPFPSGAPRSAMSPSASGKVAQDKPARLAIRIGCSRRWERYLHSPRTTASPSVSGGVKQGYLRAPRFTSGARAAGDQISTLRFRKSPIDDSPSGSPGRVDLREALPTTKAHYTYISIYGYIDIFLLAT